MRAALLALRFALTAPYTLAGVVWGLAWGGRRHESIHATQWAIFGPLLPPLYWIAEAIYPHERNPFERWAGLRDGGYIR